MDACEVIILDVRVPCTPVARLNNHRACVNGIAWAPTHHATSAQLRTTTRLSSGTFSKCHGQSRTPSWHTLLRARSTRFSGRPPSPTGLRSVITVAWKYCVSESVARTKKSLLGNRAPPTC
uniref:Uncharacterized protein n=1 Tax=Rhipicephalus microplus TaxID=6941 RepID=A0A6G5ACE2_RHIMP